MSTAVISAAPPLKISFDGRPPAQGRVRKVDEFDLWSSIHSSKDIAGRPRSSSATPYVHPLVRRSSNLMSQRSLEICTESLGSETGSDGFSDIDDYLSSLSPGDSGKLKEVVNEAEFQDSVEEGGDAAGKKWLEAVNYHCSVGRQPTVRSYPPPLPSISRRDGPCVRMRTHREDGRLVIEAVPVPSQNYLHCQRRDGRLLLTFIDTTFKEIYPDIHYSALSSEEQEEQGIDAENIEEEEEKAKNKELVKEEETEEEEEEEVEVVDRGIVVEVKVSRMKAHRSSLVINKFVSGAPLLEGDKVIEVKEPAEADHGLKIATILTTNGCMLGGTAVKASLEEAYVWRSTGEGQKQQQHHQSSQDIKLLFTSKKLMNRQTLLHQVRRCSFQHKPLFIWEGCCIATTG